MVYEAGKLGESSLHVTLMGETKNTGRTNLEDLQAERDNKFMAIREKKCLPTINENSEEQSEFKNTFLGSKMNLCQESPRSETNRSDKPNNYPNSYSEIRPTANSLITEQHSMPTRNRDNSFKKRPVNY